MKDISFNLQGWSAEVINSFTWLNLVSYAQWTWANNIPLGWQLGNFIETSIKETHNKNTLLGIIISNHGNENFIWGKSLFKTFLKKSLCIPRIIYKGWKKVSEFKPSSMDKLLELKKRYKLN